MARMGNLGVLGFLALVFIAAGCNRPFLFDGRIDAQVATSKPLEANLKVDLDLVPRKGTEPLVTVLLPGGSGDRRVAIIELDGLLVHDNYVGLGSQGSNPLVLFHEKLMAAELDPKVAAVVIRINSPGGTVAASETMAQELNRFRKRSGKRVVAHILETGAGGAYRIALEADQIVATPAAVVGGIGVIFPLLNLEKSLDVLLVTDQSIKAGAHIDLGSNSRKMENHEKEMLEAMAKEHHERFRVAVRSERKDHNVNEQSLDGRVMSATKAKEAGLIDGIGTLEESLEMAFSASSIGKSSSGSRADYQVIMYRHPGENVVSIYDLVPNQPLQGTILPVSVPGFDRGRYQTFWYLWMPDSALPRLTGK